MEAVNYTYTVNATLGTTQSVSIEGVSSVGYCVACCSDGRFMIQDPVLKSGIFAAGSCDEKDQLKLFVDWTFHLVSASIAEIVNTQSSQYLLDDPKTIFQFNSKLFGPTWIYRCAPKQGIFLRDLISMPCVDLSLLIMESLSKD